METVKIESIHDEITVRAHPDGDIEVWQGPHEMTVESVALPALIAALQAAMPDGGWLPIESAPKDGRRVMLWRGECGEGSWAEMVIAEWFEGAWRWPDDREEPSTHGEWSEDDLIEGYADNESFTHWQPLPPPPSNQGEGR